MRVSRDSLKLELIEKHRFLVQPNDPNNLMTLTLIQPGKARFFLTYISLDYHYAAHTGLPSKIRVKKEEYCYNHLLKME